MKPRRPDDSTPDQTLLPGRKPVAEALARPEARIDTVYIDATRKGPEIEEIFRLCRERNIKFRPVTSQELTRLHPGNHQGVIARLYAPGFTNLDDFLPAIAAAPLPLAIALDQVQDPGNVGTLARTLYALGGAGLIITKDRAAYLGGAAQKTSAGALAALPVCQVVNLARTLDAAQEQGLTIYGTGLTPTAQNLFTHTPTLPAILVLGGEDKGLRPNVAKRCDTILRIPFARHFDSLNVAQAGAIVLGTFAQYLTNK